MNHLNNELLHVPTIPFDFKNPPVDPTELVEQLTNQMIALRGVGLSANQVGLPYRVFVMGNPGDKNSIIPVFNMSIVNYGDEKVYGEESCLSFPGLYLSIKRSKEIRTRMTTINGETDVAKFTGYTARLFQNEYGHMEGTDFKTRATRYHMEKGLKNMKLMNRKRKRNAA